MQSRTAIRSLRLFTTSRTCLLPLARASFPTTVTLDRATHSGDPQTENSEVGRPVDPSFQQKLRFHDGAPYSDDHLEGVSCIGWDGNPLGGDAAGDSTGSGDDDKQQQQWQVVQEQEEDYKEYFEHHKPSPLSGLEFVDTRRPIRQATDSWIGGGNEVVVKGWREEQLDTVDDALSRAEAIYRESAERGDPDSPQGRVLARYRDRCCHELYNI